MTYEEFLEFVPAKCMYETIYDDSEGRTILVISLLDAYGMVNKAITALRLAIDVQNMASESTYKAALAQPAQLAQRTWVGLDEKDFSAINQSCLTKLQAATSAESVLKEKNT